MAEHWEKNEAVKQALGRLDDLSSAIGNTPLATIRYRYKGKEAEIYAKVEAFNLTGSVKDRMAHYTLKEALKKGDFKVGDTIVEATSGNTGIAFCALGAYLRTPVVIYMPEWMSEERKKLITSFGAEIRTLTHEEGGFIGSIERAFALAKEDGYYCPAQFENPFNAAGQYESLGKEIVQNLKDLGLTADAFVAGVGTGGTVMGAGRALRTVNPNCKIHPLEPAESPTLSTGGEKVGEHRIAGISDEFVPDLLKMDECDDIVQASDGDAVLIAQALAKLGLGVGISSGGNVAGAIKLREKMGDGAVVVTVLSDDNKKYLSTSLLQEEPMKDEYVAKDLEILSITMSR
ncbi:MAG: PLP-dependent cysteine synthase family protein [Tissierellia bacterium]|nr:PLP-dependent cysteine synthase family protein [Tissierellia bacterium]